MTRTSKIYAQEDTLNNPPLDCSPQYPGQQAVLLRLFAAFSSAAPHVTLLLLCYDVENDMVGTRKEKVTYSTWHG